MTELERLTTFVQSNEYDCPLCGRYGRQERGTITLEWEHECDDMGYPVASWPVFAGTCTDEPINFEEARFPLSRQQRSSLNHAAQLNALLENDESNEQVGWVLGQSRARKQVADLLGIPVRR